MAPYPIGIGNLSIVDHDRGGDIEFILIFFYILFFIFYGHLKKN